MRKIDVTWLNISFIRVWVQFAPADLKEHMEELEEVNEKLGKWQKAKKRKCEFQIKADDGFFSLERRR